MIQIKPQPKHPEVWLIAVDVSTCVGVVQLDRKIGGADLLLTLKAYIVKDHDNLIQKQEVLDSLGMEIYVVNKAFVDVLLQDAVDVTVEEKNEIKAINAGGYCWQIRVDY